MPPKFLQLVEVLQKEKAYDEYIIREIGLGKTNKLCNKLKSGKL